MWSVLRSRDGLRLEAVEAISHGEHLGDECFEVVPRVDRGGWKPGGFDAICEDPLHSTPDGVARPCPADEAVGEVVVAEAVQCNCGGHCAVPLPNTSILSFW